LISCPYLKIKFLILNAQLSSLIGWNELIVYWEDFFALKQTSGIKIGLCFFWVLIFEAVEQNSVVDTNGVHEGLNFIFFLLLNDHVDVSIFVIVESQVVFDWVDNEWYVDEGFQLQKFKIGPKVYYAHNIT
jgi:hypothetical protein